MSPGLATGSHVATKVRQGRKTLCNRKLVLFLNDVLFGCFVYMKEKGGPDLTPSFDSFEGLHAAKLSA